MKTMSNELRIFLYQKLPTPISSDRSFTNQPRGQIAPTSSGKILR
jgi:hypothetical protein